MENYSLSDLAAVTNNDCGFGGGGNSAWVLIILFALIFGWGGNGFGNNRNCGCEQYATSAEVQRGFDTNALEQQIRGITYGLSESTFSLNNAINQSNNNLGNMITSEGRSLQNQIAQCCCDNREATAQVRYDMANFACSINQNIDNKFAALEKAQLEQTIQAQANQINQLALSQQLCGVVRYPTNSTWALNGNPFCGFNSGCCCN